MLVSSYNNNGLNDVLIVMTSKSSVENQTFVNKKNITEIIDKESNEVVGFNFFNASAILALDESGPINLTNEQVDTLNSEISKVGFDETLTPSPSPKFVVGDVKECEPHEDSDHLNVTQTEVDNGDILQIVCGASNIAQGQKVVVAKPGAIMPGGLVVWPGKLRGVESNGMICSARELGINSDQKKGILVLDESEQTGSKFDFA